MTKKDELMNLYSTLKYQEYLEPDPDKRKEYTKKIRIMEDEFKRQSLNDMFEDNEMELDRINKDELTGGIEK